jgi:methyl-accepting chemotaxis protein
MLARIRYLVFGIIVFSVSVLGYNLFTTFGMKNQIQLEVSVNTPNYRRIIDFGETLIRLKDRVTQAALSRYVNEIEDSEKDVAVIVQDLKHVSTSIEGSYLKTLIVEEDGLDPWSLDSHWFESELKEIESQTSRTLQSAKELVSNSRNLEKNRKELSRVYRAMDNFLNKNKAYAPQLARATLTILSSNSSKDINFAGLAQYKEAASRIDAQNKVEADRVTWTQFKELFEKTAQLASAVAGSSEDNQIQIYRDHVSERVKKIDKIKELAESQFNIKQSGLVTAANKNLTFSSALTILMIALTLIGTFKLLSLIIKQLNERLHFAKQISRGVKLVSEKFIEMSQSLSENASTQTQELTSASSAVTEIQQMTVSSAEATQECFRISKETSEKAKQGESQVVNARKSVEHLNQEISTLLSELKTATEEMQEMKALVTSISDKTKVINDIVFQTKLLSFNASVEAARAGEHGKGFAVVAEEISRLASMSGESATEINLIIEKSETRVEELVSKLQEKLRSSSETAQIALGNTLKTVVSSSEAFQTVSRLVLDLDSRILSISQAAKEQATGIERVESAVTEVNQGNVKVSEDARSSFERSTEMGKEAQKLLSLVNQLEEFMVGAKTNSTEENTNLPDVSLSESQIKKAA